MAALVVGLVLFGIPAILMGMVSPYAARLFVHELPHMGTGVGLVYSISTVGSILGTIATTFYLMTFLGTRADLGQRLAPRRPGHNTDGLRHSLLRPVQDGGPVAGRDAIIGGYCHAGHR